MRCLLTLARLRVRNPFLGFIYRDASTGGSSKCSILKLPAYKDMKLNALVTKGKSPDQKPLDIVSSHILRKNLKVNETILMLNVCAVNKSLQQKYVDEEKLKAMREKGYFKTRPTYTIKHDEIIVNNYNKLVREAKLDDDSFRAELLQTNTKFKDFMLKRNLVGFFLLQGLPDGDKRFPVDVFFRLLTVLTSGQFSQKDDQAILAWVSKHGAGDWTKLAKSLGRVYKSAGVSIKNRHTTLVHKQNEHRSGVYTNDETVTILKYAVKKNPKYLEDGECPNKIIWSDLSPQMKRLPNPVNHHFLRIDSVIKRYNAGTLDEDIRGILIHDIKNEGWTYGSEIDWEFLLSRPQYAGHTKYSMMHVYNNLRVLTKRTKGTKKNREITITEVDEWYGTSQRLDNNRQRIQKEKFIIETYLEMKKAKNKKIKKIKSM